MSLSILESTDLFATVYAGSSRRLVQRLKYEAQPWVGRSMGRLMARRYQSRDLGPGPNLVVSVPLHPSRYRHRGYNQAEILAKEFAKQMGFQMHGQILQRIRATPHQVGLSQDNRQKNLLKAFRASTECVGMRILLVDDVATTGATLKACSEALLEKGAREITGYTWAKGLLRSSGT